MARAPDVTVIGAGLVGTMTALGLAEAGLRTTLIDAAFAGSGSTGAAMGHLVAMDDSAEQLALCAHSLSRWRGLADTLPARAEYDHCGTLWIAATDAELEAARQRGVRYRTRGIAAQVVDPDELYRLEPQLRRGLAGALLVRDDSVCYPPVIASVLSERAAARGAQLLNGVRVRGVAAQAVHLDDGTTIGTGAIVVAAGVGSPALVPGLPIVPRKGHLIITDRRPSLVRHQLVELGYLHSAHTMGGASVAFNVQPRRTGQVLIGSSRELVGFDAQTNHRLMARMLARAIEFVPALSQVRAVRSWVGFRPATPDALPLIGRWPEVAGMWIAAGHEGLGITMATGTADLIVAGILGQQPPVDPAPFRPDRPMPTMAQAA